MRRTKERMLKQPDHIRFNWGYDELRQEFSHLSDKQFEFLYNQVEDCGHDEKKSEMEDLLCALEEWERISEEART